MTELKSIVIIIVALAILVLVSLFIFQFVLPARRLKRDLSSALIKLHEIKESQGVPDIERIGKDAMVSEKFQHLWSEFKESLHPQKEPDEMGQERVVRWRSTLPAETYFNAETLIAVELRTEYFKHQPGILTGLGILGTFAGLLSGLYSFSVSSDPEVVRSSLGALIHGVFEAFILSAFAISMAMLTTYFEKIIITGRIKQVEELCHLLDSLFEGGAGEEYLSRLVHASESSATQTAQLKDALVADLKELLTEMTRQQAETIAASFQQITQQHVAAISEGSKAQIETTEQSGERIARAITESLNEPIQRIAAAVENTADTNGQMVTRALNEALVGFSQKLEDLFGGQMTNMNRLLLQTTESMQATVARFDQLANNLNDAGTQAADAMSERLSKALESLEARQQALNSTMSEFVSQIRDMVHTSQTETSDRLQQSFAMMGEKLSVALGHLEQQAASASSAHKGQQDQLAQSFTNLIGEMNSQVQLVMGSMQQQMLQITSAMQDQTAEAAGLNEKSQKHLADVTQSTVVSLSERMESSISAMDARMVEFIELMRKQSEAATNTHESTQQQLSTHFGHVMEQISRQIQTVIQQTGQAVSAMQEVASSMRAITGDASRRMESSAQMLSVAAEDFAQAGTSVFGVMQQTGQVGNTLSSTAGVLNSAASVVHAAIDEYNAARDAVTHMVGELKKVVEVAKLDVGMSQSLVSQMQQSAQQLESAHSSVEGLLEQICADLGDAHEAFAQNVENTLKKSNSAFQKELKDAVDYLKSAVEELGDVAEAIPAVR